MKKRVFFLPYSSFRASIHVSAMLALHEKQTEKSGCLPDPRFAVWLILSWLAHLTPSLWWPWFWGWLYSSRCLNFGLLVESHFREESCLKTWGAVAQRHKWNVRNTEMYFYFGTGCSTCPEPDFNVLPIRARRGHQLRWAVCSPWGNSMWACGFILGLFKVRKKKYRGKK